MTSPYKVRPAEGQDLDRLIELLLALQDHIEASNPNLWQMKSDARSNLRGQIASRLRADQGRALVAEHEKDGVVGMIFGRIVSNSRYLAFSGRPHRPGLCAPRSSPGRARLPAGGGTRPLFRRPGHRGSLPSLCGRQSTGRGLLDVPGFRSTNRDRRHPAPRPRSEPPHINST